MVNAKEILQNLKNKLICLSYESKEVSELFKMESTTKKIKTKNRKKGGKK